MLFFNWCGQDTNQKFCQGTCIAANYSDAEHQLKRKNIEIQSIQEQPKWQQWLQRAQVKKKDIYWLIHKISMMLSAGITLTSALETLSNQKNNMQTFTALIMAHIQHGSSLKKAFESTQLFDSLALNLIEAGQETGALEICFKQLHNDQNKNLHLMRQIQSALFYPIVLAMITACVAYFLLTEILPGICEMYAHQPEKLPWITQQLLTLMEKFDQGPFYLASLLAFGLTVSIKSWRQMLCLRSFEILDHLPWTGAITELHMMQRFFRIFSICLQCHLPITQSLNIVKMSHFLPKFQATVEGIEHHLLQGSPLHQIMASYPLFRNQDLATNLIKVGEESGQLIQASHKLAELYESQLNHQLHTLSKAIEPIMLLIMTAVIGALIFSIYLPIFELSSLVQD
jgi:type II secretory pathway component PulF